MFAFLNSFLAIKKAICSFLVMFLSIGYSLGLSLDFQGVHDGINAPLTYCFYDSTKKIEKTEMIGKTETYNIHLAKDEYEACVLVVRSKFCSYTKYMDLEFTAFKNKDGDILPTQVYKESYMPCISDKNYGIHPDALIPLENNKYRGQPIHQINWPFYIEVHSSPETKAGTYKAKVIAHYDDEEEPCFIAEVSATVWNFTLPKTPASASALGIGKGDIAAFYNIDAESPKAEDMYKKYYDFLLDRNMSGYNLPYDILDKRADKYMSDPRVTSFQIPYCDGDDKLLVKYYKKVQSNPVWAEKGYFYPVDEPNTPEDFERYKVSTERLQRLCPGYHMVTPSNAIENDGKYSPELQRESDIFCGISNIYEDEGLRESVEKRRADGTKVWWYVCCGPTDKYCNIFTHWDGIKGRLLFWQQKDLNINGFLYWSTTYWACVDSSPWKGALTTPWTHDQAFGDGSLFYPTKDGPTPSLRLTELSDGFDDYDLLTMAEELFGTEYIDEKIDRVSKNLTSYTLNDKRLTEVRNEIGYDIEKELNK